MEDSMIQSLVRFVVPRTYQKGDCICYEGQPGDEMFIILSGSVGIYITSLLGDNVQVAKMEAGEFFGEMSPFDHMPRSATCIAEEETVCAVVGRNNIHRLITDCPDIIEKLLSNFSARIRDLNNKLYKVENPNPTIQVKPFSLPEPFPQHRIFESEHAGKFLDATRATCPICEKRILINNIRTGRLKLERPKILPSQRKVYTGFDPLWHYAWECDECGYTNYYLDFFRLYDCTRGDLIQVIQNQKQYLTRIPARLSPFDHVIISYYRAIHLNECVNDQNGLLLGKLWRQLGWLYADAGEAELEAICRHKALPYYEAAFQAGGKILQSEGARQQCALVLAELYYEENNPTLAKTYYFEVIKYSNKTLAQPAYDRLYEMRAISERRILR